MKWVLVFIAMSPGQSLEMRQDTPSPEICQILGQRIMAAEPHYQQETFFCLKIEEETLGNDINWEK